MRLKAEEQDDEGTGSLPYLVQKFGSIKAVIHDPSTVAQIPASGDPEIDKVVKNVARRNPGHVHENTVVEYSRAMGEAREKYTAGIDKYILNQVDNAMMAGRNIVKQYTSNAGVRKIRLDKLSHAE